VIIIWGLRTLIRTIAQGDFYCPHCGGDRHYQRRQARRWFTFFFIPVIPLNKRGEFIRCTACGNNFNDGVLSRPTTGQLSDLLGNALRAALVMVLRCGGYIQEGARAAAVTEIVNAGTPGYTEATLDADLSAVPADPSQLLSSLDQQLAVPGKEAFLAAAIRVGVAASQRGLNENERNTIEGIGARIGMTPAHIDGVIAAHVTQDAPGA
jgi:hypothetical protein